MSNLPQDKKRKLIGAIVFGLIGGALFIAINSGNLKTAFICGTIIGLIFLIWSIYFLGSGVSRAKKFAEQAIRDGEIKDYAKAELVIKVLNVLEDTDSKYLLVKLKELLSK